MIRLLRFDCTRSRQVVPGLSDIALRRALADVHRISEDVLAGRQVVPGLSDPALRRALAGVHRIR